MTTLGLIPARGGSKGVPRKNLIELGGKSLIHRAVTALKESNLVDHILVSTDDEDIANEARKSGATVLALRPKELALDTSPILPVLEYEICLFEEKFSKKVKTIVFTEPVTPFRNAGHVRSAIERYNRRDVSSVITVCSLERKPQNIFVKNNKGFLERYIEVPDERYERRQDMEHLCRLSNGIYVVGREDLFANKSLSPEPIGYVDMKDYESVNIDTELDVIVARAISEKYGI